MVNNINSEAPGGLTIGLCGVRPVTEFTDSNHTFKPHGKEREKLEEQVNY
jgi:hypothetical protein